MSQTLLKRNQNGHMYVYIRDIWSDLPSSEFFLGIYTRNDVFKENPVIVTPQSVFDSPEFPQVFVEDEKQAHKFFQAYAEFMSDFLAAHFDREDWSEKVNG